MPLQWYWNHFYPKPDKSYSRFKTGLYKRFDDEYGNGRSQTKALAMRYTAGNLLDHVDNVLHLLSKDDYMPEVKKVNLVLETLPDEVTNIIRGQKPKTCDELLEAIRDTFPKKCQPSKFVPKRHQFEKRDNRQFFGQVDAIRAEDNGEQEPPSESVNESENDNEMLKKAKQRMKSITNILIWYFCAKW